MNIINKLTRKHMLTNKKRTLVTILGIIISVAMFTAVTTGTASVEDFFQRLEMEDSGYWHMAYKNVSKDTANKLKQEDNIKNLSLSEELGYSKFLESTNEEKPYVFVMGMDAKCLDMMNVKLIAGRFPQNAKEVLLPEHLLKFSAKDYEVGDTFKIELGKRYVVSEEGEKFYLDQENSYLNDDEEQEQFESEGASISFTIVGFIERPKLEAYSAPGFTLISGLRDTDTSTYIAKIFLNQVTGDIYKEADAIAKDMAIDKVTFNSSLLKYYGVSVDDSYNDMMFYMEVILIAIILVGSVSLIYNSFAISISERTKQFGMLSSVGTTKKQKMKAVLYEGIVCGCISIPIGIVAGVLGIGITFWAIQPMFQSAFQMELAPEMVVSFDSILAAIIVSIVTILISAYLPARKASKITAMEAIRQQKDIKVSKRAFRTSRLNRKLFGLEGDLAAKNLKRNKKRYRVIVFSLGISIVLFISVNAYTHYLSEAVELNLNKNEGDVVIGNITYEESRKVLPYLKELDTLSEVTVRYDFTIRYELSHDDTLLYASKEWLDLENKTNDNLTFSITALDDSAFVRYAKNQGIEVKSIDDDLIPVIVINRQRDVIQYTLTDLTPLEINAGTRLKANTWLWEEDKVASKEAVDFYVLGSTKRLPLGMIYYGGGDEIQVITSESSIKSLPTVVGDERVVPNTRISSNTNAPDRITAQITEIMNREVPYHSSYVYNQAEEAIRSQQMVTVFNVFAYGFIFLISLISVANMCNTISTSFAVRRNEFAMLKSVGMTPKAFKKMIVFESLLYGIKALIFGIPIGLLFNYLIYKSVNSNFTTEYNFPYQAYVIAVVFVFLVVGAAMLYSTSKIRKDNIIDGLKSEII